MPEMKSIPVVQGVFEQTPDGPRLIGSRCPNCASVYFPQSDYCANPKCGGQRTEAALLGPRGTIWSFSVLHYPPPPPFEVSDVPYTVAYVDLDEGIRITAMLTATGAEAVAVGAMAELVIEPIRVNTDGNEVLTWKFDVLEGGPR